MSSFQNKIQPDPNNPFANCKLDREKYANILTDIIKKYPKGFVLAINNKWGEGKTTFIEMWRAKLEKEEFKTVYFNAWENDFEDNPFISIISEIKSVMNTSSSDTYKNLLEKGTIISKAFVPAIAKFAAKKIFGDEIAELSRSATEGVINSLEIEIDDYLKKKESIKEFKVTLQQLINENLINLPLVVFIDELDRCNPHFAVKTLENVKHLFSVENVVFVISIDKIQLGHSVRGYYGNDNIDAEEYLKRFFDVEYSIPEPEKGDFLNYMYTKLDFESFFNNRPAHYELQNENKHFYDFLKFQFTEFKLTLRQLENITSVQNVFV